jgi:hypothetical protein
MGLAGSLLRPSERPFDDFNECARARRHQPPSGKDGPQVSHPQSHVRALFEQIDVAIVELEVDFLRRTQVHAGIQRR